MSESSNAKSVDELLTALYSQLASFKSASERLSEQHIVVSNMTEGWKSATVSYRKVADDTLSGLSDVVSHSKSLADRCSTLYDMTATLTDEIKKSQIDINNRYSAIDLSLTKLQTQSTDLHKSVLAHNASVSEGIENQRLFIAAKHDEVVQAVLEDGQRVRTEIDDVKKLMWVLLMISIVSIALAVGPKLIE